MKKRELKRVRKLAVLLSAVLLMEQPMAMNPAIVAHAQGETVEVVSEEAVEEAKETSEVADSAEEAAEETSEEVAESVEETVEETSEEAAEESSEEVVEDSTEAEDEEVADSAEEAAEVVSKETSEETAVESVVEAGKGIAEEILNEVAEVVVEEMEDLPIVADGDPTSSDVTKHFTDVPAGQWYVSAVQFVYDNAIMNGVSDTSFAPAMVLTREQFITVLYNMVGAPETAYKKIFSDVTDETIWYAKAVTWASENGITSGIGDQKFGTGVEITREQLATLLYNFVQQKEENKVPFNEKAVANYPDAGQISEWAADGMKWAVTNEIMKGKAGQDGKNLLDPLGKASRAECAQMIKNFVDAGFNEKKKVYLDGSAVIFVEGFEEKDSIITTEEKITLRGTIQNQEEEVEFTCSMYSAADKTVRDLPMDGIADWTVSDIPLDIGTNYISFIFKNSTGEYCKEVRVIRDSTELQAKDSVVGFNVNDENQLKEVEQIYAQILDSWKDDKGTETTDDDEVCIAVNETNPLYGYIKSGKINSGDVVFIPENDYFIAGFTMIYQSHDDKVASDVEGYDASKYEVLHMAEASIMDLIDGDISINMNELDQEDPVAFIYNPYSEYLKEQPDVLAGTVDPTRDFSFGNALDVMGPGLQVQNLARIFPTVDLKTSGEIKVGFTDVIIYDKDGDGDTSNDRIVLSGTSTMSDIHPTVGVEWHPVKTGNMLPNQLIQTLEYKEVNSFKITAGADAAPEKMIGAKFDNKRECVLGGLIDSIEGVDTSKTVFLASVGLHVVSEEVEVKNIKDISDSSYAIALEPIVVLSFIIDTNGETKAELSVEMKETSYIKKGLNVQQDGFYGNYGTVEQNKGTYNLSAYAGKYLYHFNLYNIKQRAKDDSGDPEKELNFILNGSNNVYFGFGGSLGVMVCGIMPAMVKVSVGPKLSMNGDCKLTISNYPHTNSKEILGKYVDIVGNLVMKLSVVARVTADIKVKAETGFGNATLQLSLDPPYEIDLWKAFEFSTIPVNGYVYTQDYDGDESNDKPIAGAEVILKEKKSLNPQIFSATTDANGYFEMGGVLDSFAGDYEMTIIKNGYEDYKDNKFKVDTVDHKDDNRYYMERNKGKLKLKVVDKSGKPVSAADVQICSTGQYHSNWGPIVIWEAADPDNLLIKTQTNVDGIVEVDLPARNGANGCNGCYTLYVDKDNKMGAGMAIGRMEWPRCIWVDTLEEGAELESSITLKPYSNSTGTQRLDIQVYDGGKVLQAFKTSFYKGWNRGKISNAITPDYKYNVNGEFLISNVAQGRYTVKIEVPGYKEKYLEVLVADNSRAYRAVVQKKQ